MKIAKLALLTCSMILPLAASAAQDLSALYQVFEDKGNSTLSMEEYNQSVSITGIALELSQNMQGAPLLIAGDEEGYILARLQGVDAAQNAKMSALQEGQRFNAECVLQFASGSDYMPFHQCTFN
ncbi:hypothetical protein EXN22_22020 [Pseudomonas tructae]|uniref:Uncharacterized protein n=1 Tax=Pseudomonas tructae TaxID=2518644 RepID=A0A411MN66_9PSED|nr:hypothetical protein [Pseudomonas tructae]QBF28232.1 hypothetical protein EXN22_22020 [Pseudomonas tructae]